MVTFIGNNFKSRLFLLKKNRERKKEGVRERERERMR
jgi:hypothetical protein